MIEINSVPLSSCAQGEPATLIRDQLAGGGWSDIVPTLVIAKHPLLTTDKRACATERNNASIHSTLARDMGGTMCS
jgi:hypothetical protein